MKLVYGWFSEEQARNFGSLLYLDKDGNEVEVSCVSEKENAYAHINDIRFVTMVQEGKYRRSSRLPLVPLHIYYPSGRKEQVNTPSSSKSSREMQSDSILNQGQNPKRDRQGDETILGTAIERGVYEPKAGIEKIGYFDPETAPFRVISGDKIAVIHGLMANMLIQMMQSVGTEQVKKVYGTALDKTGDLAVDIAVKLGLSSTEEVAKIFHQLAMEGNIAEFLLVTTTMPFFLTYSIGKTVVALTEVELELRLNALANLLLNDSDFSSVHSAPDFKARAQSLRTKRSKEFEEKKQWAIELKKSRTV